VTEWRAASQNPVAVCGSLPMLLELYAPEFLAQHRAEMLQNFQDLENAASPQAARSGCS
jgi:hypothetical protein